MTGVERPTAGEVEAAAALLAEVTQVTPLVALRAEGADGIHLKVELHQPGGCFKIRGVYHAVARMDPEWRARGLSTVSAGNTAKALAWAGRSFGVEARSLMPDHAPKTKVEAVRALGGTPVLKPVEEVFAFLKEHRWEQEPYAFVHPWTDRDVMIGHGTLALEILEQMPEVETVYVPVGGGGLLGGVGSALKALKPTVRIVAVEPAGCPSLHAAIEAGEPVEVEMQTMCDGVAVPYITQEVFPLLRELVDETALVSEEDVRAMIAILAMKNHLVAEGAGALAAAAALAADPKHRQNSVALITGGSIDAAVLADILTPR